MTEPTEGNKTATTTETTFEIIELLKTHDGAKAADLYTELNLVKSTIHRHLNTLQHLGYVTKERDVYYLTHRFLELGEYTRYRKEAYNMAKPLVKELAEETEERAQFLVEENGYGVFLHRAHGKHAVTTGPGVGGHVPLHATAAGKACLAYLPTDRVKSIVETRGLEEYTEHTITDQESLFDELETIRDQNYSVNEQENLEGLKAIGTAIKSSEEGLIGSFSVTGPTHRMKGQWFDEDLPNLLLGITNELELNLVHG